MPSAKRKYNKRKRSFSLNLSNIISRGKGDTVMIGVVFFLVLFGLILVYDASAVIASQLSETNHDQFFFLKRQLLWVGIGIVAFFFTYNFDYHNYPRYVIPGLAIVMAALVAVYIFGEERYGARRWIDIGGFDLQPSELAKLVFTIYLASWLARQKSRKGKFKQILRDHFNSELLPFVLILGVICLLIVFQPDLGTAAIVGATALAVYFIAGTDMLHTIGSISIVILMGFMAIIATAFEGYRLGRVQTYLETIRTGEVPDKFNNGYQLFQTLIAVGSGGVTGLGFAESRQKHGYLGLYTTSSDSIFAVIAEELGFVGGVLLVLITLFFIFRGIRIALRAPDRLGTLLASGITIWIGAQIFLHIAVNIALVPFTGVPLPFISYGGSGMIVTLTAMGILLNISRQEQSPSKKRK